MGNLLEAGRPSAICSSSLLSASPQWRHAFCDSSSPSLTLGGAFATAGTGHTSPTLDDRPIWRVSGNITGRTRCHSTHEESHVKRFQVERLEQAGGDGPSEGGLLYARAGTVRPNVSTDARLPRLHHHRENQARDRSRDPAYGKKIEDTIAASRDALVPLQLPLPAMAMCVRRRVPMIRPTGHPSGRAEPGLL